MQSLSCVNTEHSSIGEPNYHLKVHCFRAVTEIVLRSVSRCGYGCGITLVPLIAWAKKTTSTSEQACIKTALWKVCAHYEQKCTSSVHAFYSYLETVLKSVGIQFSEGSSFTFCFNINRLFPQILSLFSPHSACLEDSLRPLVQRWEHVLFFILCPLCWDSHTAGPVPVPPGAQYGNEPIQHYTLLHLQVVWLKSSHCDVSSQHWIDSHEENKIKLQLLIKINNVFI